MKRVVGWVELERRLTPDDEWETNMQFSPDFSIEQARVVLERAQNNGPLLGTTYRLVYVRVETTREVID
jgi:hypothetical protein